MGCRHHEHSLTHSQCTSAFAVLSDTSRWSARRRGRGVRSVPDLEGIGSPGYVGNRRAKPPARCAHIQVQWLLDPRDETHREGTRGVTTRWLGLPTPTLRGRTVYRRGAGPPGLNNEVAEASGRREKGFWSRSVPTRRRAQPGGSARKPRPARRRGRARGSGRHRPCLPAGPLRKTTESDRPIASRDRGPGERCTREIVRRCDQA